MSRLAFAFWDALADEQAHNEARRYLGTGGGGRFDGSPIAQTRIGWGSHARGMGAESERPDNKTRGATIAEAAKSYEFNLEHGLAIVGSPETVVREIETRRQRLGYDVEYTPLAHDTRQRLAALIGADADEMAFTDSTTYGINIAVWGHRWRHDDEVLTSTVEHRGILVPLHSLSRRTGVSLRTVAPEALPYAITDHTRMVPISHVSFSTGARLPIGDVAQAARDTGALVLVDGAQAVGALPVDVHALDVDLYAFPGQKWLFRDGNTL